MSTKIFCGTMLVSDLDGTLLDSKFEISSENQAALQYYTNHGGIFTIATGRMEFAVKDYLKLLPINAPAILYNGALVYDFHNNSALWSQCLVDPIETIINELMGEFPRLGIEVFQGGYVYFLQQNEYTDRHRIKEGFTPHIVPIAAIPNPWYKIILAWDPSKLPLVESFLKDKTTTFRMVYSEPQFLELLHRDTSKGESLKVLAEKMGISMKQIIAVGDNMNDFELLKTAGIGFAVDNAHESLKQVAHHICCHHNEHALAYIVKWLYNELKANQFNIMGR